MSVSRPSSSVPRPVSDMHQSGVRRIWIAVLAAAILVAAVGQSARVDPTLFQDLRWRLIGPFRGGRVLAVTGVPREPEHFYFGSVNGGVWETRDAGRTWTPIFDGQSIGSIGAIAIAPSNPGILYVGTGEADMRSDIAQGDGMFRSSDGGKSWHQIGLQDSQQIAKIVVHPDNANLIYVAALGHPYGPNSERGLYRSRDGGQTWQRVLTRNHDSDTGAIDVAFEPGNPSVIYAALWQTRRTPWSVYPPSSGPGSGLFKSTDGGDHWTELKGHGLPDRPGRIGLAIAPTAPQRVYAIIDAERGGIFRSDDGGANWTRTTTDARVWGRGWYFGGITVEPKNADVVYSCNTNLYRSDDGGKTFAPVKGGPGGDDYHTLWLDPDRPERRILGVDQGALVSINGGATWSSWYNQPTGQFYHCITDNRFPYWVYGSQQDSGAAGVPSRSNTIDGINMTGFREITAGGESDNVAPDPTDPDILFGGRVEILDTKSHQTRSVDPTLAYPENDRRTWTLPLVFSRRDPHVLYFSNQKLFRTDDRGSHWKVISPDLTREDPGVPPNLDAATAALKPEPSPRHGVIYAIAPSRVADHDVWVGTDDGLIWRTRDEGAHWQNITPGGLTGWSKISIIDTSHFDAETAYAAVDRHRLEDTRPYIYRTHDGGLNWDLISTGIPAGFFVNAVREDSVRKGLLYAGTEKGVFVSFDDGDRWQPLQMNLPVTSVRDIDVHDDDIVIATHGRAFWVMDQVTPLRQLAESPRIHDAMLFRPPTAVRERPAGFTGTPMPKDEPMASNPPSGAYIDYALPVRATQPVTLEVFDERDALVRRYTSAQAAPVADPARLRVAPEWFETPSTLSTSPGMHRFVWPLRYEAPAALAPSGRGTWADGVWAPPGNYRVVLTVDGKRMTQPLVVVPDPRVRLAPEAYAQQYALAREVTETQAAVAAALDEAETLVKNTLARRDTVHPAMRPALDALLNRAVAISDAIVAVNPSNFWWRAPQQMTSLRFLNTALEKLAGAVDGADGAPSADAHEGYNALRAPAEATVKAWNDFKSNDVAAFNRTLRAANQPPIL